MTKKKVDLSENKHLVPYFTKEKRKKLSKAALNCFLGIVNSWNLTDAEKMSLLKIKDRAEFKRIQKNKSVILSNLQLEIISYNIRIYKSLATLFPKSIHAQKNWMKSKNSFFDGHPAIDFILENNNFAIFLQRLIYVTEYLEGQLY